MRFVYFSADMSNIYYIRICLAAQSLSSTITFFQLSSSFKELTKIQLSS